MAQHPCFPLWTDAYLGDTGHLSTTEHGAYLLLLMTMWRNKGRLPYDDKLLARYARMTPSRWQQIKPTIMAFFDVENGELTQGRLTDEYNLVKQYSLSQSRKARSRWLKEKKTSMPVHPPGNAYPSLTPLYSVAKATDASVPCKQVDPKKVVYESGKSLLQAYGVANGTAGGMITKWLKQHDPPEVMQAFMVAGEKERHNIIEFISGVLKNGATNEGEPLDTEGILARFRARDETGG